MKKQELDKEEFNDTEAFEDVEVIEITEEEALKLEEERRSKLESIANSLLNRRDEAIRYRASSGVERRWKEDLEAFNFSTEFTIIDPKTKQRSNFAVNIIRSKCETAVGRFCEIMLPTDKKNYSLDITPIPELNEQLKNQNPVIQEGKPVMMDNGEQAKVSDIAADQLRIAKDKMKKMETLIDDQLQESRYNTQLRRVIFDSAVYGTGIIKAPFVTKNQKKSWKREEGYHALDIKDSLTPAAIRVNPKNIYPSPSCDQDLNNLEYVWEKSLILSRDISDLLEVPGYFPEVLIDILASEPIRTSVFQDDFGDYKLDQSTIESSLYEKWEYNGWLSRKAIEEFLDIPSELAAQQSIGVNVVFINDLPVKIEMNVLDTGDIPYSFFQWTPVAESPWGIGIPRQLSWHHRVITSAWRSMLDNSVAASGRQIVVNKGVEPADGVFEFSPNKIWRNLDSSISAQNAFSQFQLTSIQAELQNIISLAMQFADTETAIPTLFQGEGQKMPETFGATQIITDSNNIALRARIKLFDDAITSTVLTRFYDFNMAYSEDEEIKGDYKVVPTGVSVLLERDQQYRSTLELYPLLADPEIAAMVDKKKLVEQLFQNKRLDVLKSDSEIQASSQEMQQIQKAQEQPQAQPQDSKLQVAQLNQESDLQELQLKYKMHQETMAHEKEIKAQEYQIALLKLEIEKQKSENTLKSKLAETSMKLKTQVALTEPNEIPREVITPAAEPTQHAVDGESFQE